MNWSRDINQLMEDLPRLHHNFFHNITKEAFYEAAEKIKSREPEMNVYSMVVALSKLIALAGDAHTALEIPKNNRMPFACYWFEEGIYITKTLSPFEGILDNQILEIEGIPLSKIIQEFEAMISHENFQFVKAQLPELLVCTDILYGLGIALDVDEVSLKLESKHGSQVIVKIPAIKYGEWDKRGNLEDNRGKAEERPLFRKNRALYYWSEKIQDGKILYVNYKKCKEMENISIETFIEDLKATLEKKLEIEGIVLDYRNNGGGNSELFRPFIEWLSVFQTGRKDEFKQSFKIFVIVGRDTFSSALLNVYLLKFKTKAIFIGEATGGKPNCYGEVNYFTLQESGLSIRYSTRYYYLIEDYQVDAFYPDFNFEVKFRDYVENVDPCLEWIEKHGMMKE